ncbi:MAG: glycosyltransferase [Myxococcota bacterium]|nr:glycosyltransferase [Myxococcota bacterium]
MGILERGRARPKLCQVHLFSIMSGPQHYTITLLERLPPDQYESHVVVATPGDGEFQRQLEELGVTVHFCPYLVRGISPVRDARAFMELRSLFRREAYDLVHTHSSKTGILGRLAARAAGVPAVVHHVHGFAFHEFSGSANRISGGVAEGAIARLSDRVIFVNEEERAWAARYGVVPPNRSCTIHNGADLQRFSTLERSRLRERARREFGIGPGQSAIVFIGRLWDQKNPALLVPTLVELGRQFPSLDPVLLVAGAGPLQDTVAREFKTAGLEERVRFLGWRSDVPAVMSAADVVYLPSLWEGLPLTLIEAACLGIPAVASDVKGNREVVLDGDTGLLSPPGDATAAARALGTLLSSPEQLAAMGGRAAQRARRLYDVSDTALKVDAIYRDLLGGSRQPVSGVYPERSPVAVPGTEAPVQGRFRAQTEPARVGAPAPVLELRSAEAVRELRLAVLGGSGFIGTRLLSELKESGIWARNGDLRTSPLHAEETLPCDVLRADQLSAVCDGATTIVNLAAEHRDNVKPASLYEKVNLGGAERVCEAASKHGVQQLIFLSSVAVYGVEGRAVDESYPPAPFTDYGTSKWKAEQVYRCWLSEDPDRSLVIVRPTAIFGEGGHGNVSTLFKQLIEGSFVMVGSGTNIKSLAYVGNLTAFVRYALRFGPGEHLYNYVDRPNLNMNSLLGQVEVLTGRRPRLRIPYGLGYVAGTLLDLAAATTGRDFSVSRSRMEKFCAQTWFSAQRMHDSGFTPPFGLEDALGRTLRYGVAEARSAGEAGLEQRG